MLLTLFPVITYIIAVIKMQFITEKLQSPTSFIFTMVEILKLQPYL